MRGMKRYHVPIAIFATVAGFALFILIAIQAGTQFRPAIAQWGSRDVSVDADQLTDMEESSLTNGGGNATGSAVHGTVLAVKDGPIRLTIEKIGVDATIEHVGLNAKNQIGIPKEFDNVAWYVNSPKPGRPGNSVINGHVNDRLSRPAIFADLDTLVAGDRVTVEYGSGKKYTFQVRETKVFDLKNAPMQEIIGPASEPRLNLITCTGTWIQSAKTYDKRLVVFTDLVE